MPTNRVARKASWLISLALSLALTLAAPPHASLPPPPQRDARLERLLSADPAVRGQAKAELLQHPDPALLPALLKELPSSQGTNRDDLIDILAKYDDPQKIPVFFAMHPWDGGVPDVGEINEQLSHLGQPAADALAANCTADNAYYANWAAGVLSWMHEIGARTLIEAVQSEDACKHSMGEQGLLYMSDADEASRADTRMASDVAVDPDERIRSAARQWFATWKGKEEQIDCSGIVEALIAAYQAKAPAATMVKIAQMLSDLGGRRVTRFMRAAVHSPNPEIQKIANDYLSRIPPESRPPAHPRSAAEKIQFIESARESSDLEVNAKLAPLVSDPDARVRAAAASALGVVNTPSTKGEDTPNDPDTALSVLGKAAKDPSPQVRAAAIGALGDIRFGIDTGLIVSALSDPDSSVVLAAENALQQVPTDSALPALTQIYRDQRTSPEMRNSAVQAMEAICNPDSIPIFIELLQASSGRPSQEIAQGLACMLQKRPDKSAFAPVLNAVQSLRPQDWILQPELLNALAETKDAGAFEPLVQLAKSQSPWTRRAAAGALGLLGDRRAIPLLSALVNDPDADVRRAAAGALTDFSDFPAPPELLATLKDPNATPDINGMRALVASRDPKAIDAMIAAMPTNPTVVYWLGEAHDTRAVPALIAYLQNPAHGAESRATAAASLGRLGDARAVEPLIASLGEDNGAITMQASAALAMLKDKRAVEPLKQALARWSTGQHQNADTVKVWISQALGQLGTQ